MTKEVIFEVTKDHLETGMRNIPVGYCSSSYIDANKGLFYAGRPLKEVVLWEPTKVIYLPYDQKTELLEQFEGYFSLSDYKLGKLNKFGLPEFPKGVGALNLMRTQLIKQADIVLLLYLFPDRFSSKLKKTNYEYYEARTMHKSSLSPCIHAIMGLEVGDHKRAYDYFIKTSHIDLIDPNRNTNEGIHAAATGGAWLTMVHGFAGMKVREKILCFDPWLPKKWKELNYSCHWQGNLIGIKITHTSVTFKLLEAKDRMVNVIVQGKEVKLRPKKTVTRKLKLRY